MIASNNSQPFNNPTVVKGDSTIAVIGRELFVAINAIVWKPGLSALLHIALFCDITQVVAQN